MTLADAKARLSIPALWARLDLPGKPTKSCKSPFREDRHASFSVSADGGLFNDFATGEAGDAVDFLQLATGLSRGAACRKFIEMVGGQCDAIRGAQRLPAAPQARQKPVLPDMRRGTADELEALARLRNVSLEALLIASHDAMGLLRVVTWKEHAAWIVTDNERLNAQARRLDGQQWEGIGAKAQTLPGSWASWPLGIKTGARYPSFLLCEGGPDLLAGLHFIHNAGAVATHFPIAMLGASQRIHADALPVFAGKRVRIMAHTDEAGREAAKRWTVQLATVGADVDCADFSGLRKADGSPVGDLNDCTSIHPKDAKELEGLLPT